MTAGTAPRSTTPLPARQSTRAASRAVTGVVVRQVRRGTTVVAVLAAGISATVALQYRTTLADVNPVALEALAQNPAIATLFGPPLALGDPGGFTVWRTGTTLAVLVGVWALLAGTRITRGEEEAGRWDLLLSGPIPLPSLVARHLGVLLAGCAAVGVAVAAGLLAGGTTATGAVLFGAGIGGLGMVGAASGVLAAQLLPDRRSASGLAVAALTAGLLTRMVADGVETLAWAQWLTPFGLLGRSAPFARDEVLPLLVLAVAVTVLGGLAVAAARARDVRAGLLPDRDVRRPRTRLLGSLPGLAVRRTLRPMLGWGAGIVAYFLLIGLLATSLTTFLADNPGFADRAAQAGFAGLGTVTGYVGAIFSLLAVPIGGFLASRVAAGAADESAGRLTLLFSLPVGRVRWAVTEAAVLAGGCVVLAAAAGAATWLGTRSVGADLGLGESLAGTLTVVPVALLCLGAALAALGWVPQHVLALGVLPAAGGYLLLVFADTFGWPGWLRWSSPFAHLARVPDEAPAWAGGLGMLAVAVALAVLGVVGFARRDLRLG